MCVGSGASKQAKKTEERLKQEEADREARIKQGQEFIDTAFQQYNQPYYDTYAKSIVDYQQPQLQEQYDRARGSLTAHLAGRGMLESTVGAQEFGNIGKVFADNSAQIANQARDAAMSLKGKVENQKSDLYALNSSAADPQGISTQAIAQATTLAAPSSISPIGDVFSAALAPYIYYNQAKMNSAGTPYQSKAPVAVGAGSSRNVR